MARDVEHSVFFERRAAEGKVVVREPPKFDLESYISNYRGRTYVDRLHLIGTTSTYFALDAIRLAVKETKQGNDVERYLELKRCLSQMLHPDDPEGVPDLGWVDSKTKQLRAEGEKLEQQLKGYKNNLIKESIRMGNEDLGAYYYSIGDLGAAHRAYSRMRDYCTLSDHVAQMSFKLILVAIAQRNWMAIHLYFQKIDQLNLRPSEYERIKPVLWACTGLSRMASHNYRAAANSFLRVGANFSSSSEAQEGIAFDRDVLTGNDVAVYGGLCALASMDRAELQSSVLGNPDFRQFLEMEPHVRRAISLFCASKFSACLEVLQEYRNDWLLDIYLQPLVDELFELVRAKCLVQFFIPFKAVSLAELERAFPPRQGLRGSIVAEISDADGDTTKVDSTDGSGASIKIEDELMDMISAEHLDARLDLVDKLLVSASTKDRIALHSQAMTDAKAYESALQLRLFRLNMQVAGLEVKAAKSAAEIEGRVRNSGQYFMPAHDEGFDVGSATEMDDDVGMKLNHWS